MEGGDRCLLLDRPPDDTADDRARCLVNTYGIPAVHAQVIAALTNTMTIAPYRGGSRPEPIYVIETIIDRAAHNSVSSPPAAPPQYHSD